MGESIPDHPRKREGARSLLSKNRPWLPESRGGPLSGLVETGES